MAVYELLPSTHPSLSVPLTEVTDDQEGREQIQQDLVDTMRAKNGIGLSANQIGIGARVFAMYADVKEKDILVCFNPKILNQSEEEILMDEGCLSYPGLWLKVRRPKGIEVTYEDNLLTVKSKKEEDAEQTDEDGNIIHRGISKRYFAKSFTIANDVEIKGAELKDGLLKIALERIIPEAKKAKTIEIK